MCTILYCVMIKLPAFLKRKCEKYLATNTKKRNYINMYVKIERQHITVKIIHGSVSPVCSLVFANIHNLDRKLLVHV